MYSTVLCLFSYIVLILRFTSVNSHIKTENITENIKPKIFVISKSDNITFRTNSENLQQDNLYKNTSRGKLEDYYCSLCCISLNTDPLGKTCGDHTMCKYPLERPGPACHGHISVRFSQGERAALLNVHNELRSKVATGAEHRGNPGPQPQASNMRYMVWNAELELFAERWATQCIYSNDICRDSERFPVGQNIARGSFARMSDVAYIKSWYDEVDYQNSSDISVYSLSSIASHYTQIVWAETYQLGCARAMFQIVKDSDLIYRQHLVCNYGPAGNVPGHAVYEKGPPCSNCPIGTECHANPPGLCQQADGSAIYSLEMKEISKYPTLKPKTQITSTSHRLMSPVFSLAWVAILKALLTY